MSTDNDDLIQARVATAKTIPDTTTASELIRKYRSLVTAPIGIALLLLIDSPTGDRWFIYGQLITIILTFLVFLRAYKTTTNRVREVMLIGIFIGLGGEILFSLVLGMYHYRLGNVPLWVAFGHGLIFWLVFRLSHATWMKPIQTQIQYGLLAFAILYSILWLYAARDWFGFLCTVAFLAILFTAKKSRLFFLIMFAVVAYIEQVGTAVGCWYWPGTIMNISGGIPSGNPPSGIAVFYFLFDASVLWIYLYILHPVTKKRYLSSPFKKSKKGT